MRVLDAKPPIKTPAAAAEPFAVLMMYELLPPMLDLTFLACEESKSQSSQVRRPLITVVELHEGDTTCMTLFTGLIADVHKAGGRSTSSGRRIFTSSTI